MQPDSYPAHLARSQPRLLPLLGLSGGPAAFDPAKEWRPITMPGRFWTPAGIDANGAAVGPDLKEAAHGGVGPHGVCAGAAGSGKSELLRTLVLGLMATHPPSTVSFVLVDAEGRGTFRDLAPAPHVAEVFADLAGRPDQVERLRDVLSAAEERRTAAVLGGDFRSVSAYEEAREGGAELPALPMLLIVVDDLQVLDRQVVVDLFLRTGRVGRSLRMHLLLATQRYTVESSLDALMSYRIVLRCFSEAESMAAAGTPQAAWLPKDPGVGYLLDGSSAPLPFKAALAGDPRTSAGQSEVDAVVSRLPHQ